MKKETTIKKIAQKYGWEFFCIQENISMLSFFKNVTDRINVYFSTMTVATCITHPKKGKTQLFRKYVTFDELEKIFKNPRSHIGKGYYTK